MRATSNTTSPILRALERSPRKISRSGAKVGSDKDSFCAEGRLSSEALSVTVRGAGALDRPVPSEAAQALHARTTPARYGRRESTLLDPLVRDTGEIGPDALRVTWKAGVLPSLMDDVADALKLHRLEASLHSLLVYGPGQFFKPHQDTEKQPGMVATLVLVWPCAHIGGELRVRHGDRQASFASQHLTTDAIRWFAFYADCRHEVLPVTEGWRIVLTFDLVVPTGPDEPNLSVPPPLVQALRTHFFPSDGASTRPWVFLLDHEYTQHGLRWALLKGEDRLRVSTLRIAAESLGLIAHLALAEIHQQWTASPDYPGYGKRHGSGDPEPDELIDESMALEYWVGSDDRPLRRDALHVPSSDVESFTDTDASFLVDEEYEGYMGNYGETLDYWYRRAALVIQTPLAAETSRFVTEFDAALADALRLARAGRGVELAQRLQAAANQLRARCQERGRTLLRPYAELAVALPDAGHARGLCDGFAWTALKPSDVGALTELARCWGPAWMKDVLSVWAQSSPRWYGYASSSAQTEREVPLWPRPLAAFIRACIRARLQGEVIDAMLEHCLSALIGDDTTLARQTPAVRHATLQRRLKAACELVSVLGLDPTLAAGRVDALLGHVRAHAGLYPLRSLRPLLEALPSGADATAEAKALGAAIVDDLQQALAEPEPSPDDYSLSDIEWTCRCADCKLVIAWATSPGAQPLMLSMAESRRSHVQSRLQDADASFGFETIRKGSPHKLVIRKPLDLRAQRRARRAAWAGDLAALAQWRRDPGSRRA